MQGVKDENLSRGRLANPARDMTYMERLIASQSIDLRDNHYIKDLGNGYSEIVPIDKNKRFGVSMKQTLERIALVRDVLIDCDGYRGNAEALEDLVEEAEEALTKILNGEEPYGVIVR